MKFLPIALTLLALAASGFAEPTLTKTMWRGIEAFALSDGRSEAVVVPKLGGRVMEYRRAGGANWLWLGEPGAEKTPPTQFWGGDKAYIGPHTMWNFTLPRMWPPPEPDAVEHAAEVLGDGALRTTSPPWEGYDGARIVREYRFEAGGDFVIRHSIAAMPASRAIGAVWTITQIAPPAAVFVPLNPVSPYKDNFFWFAYTKAQHRQCATIVSPPLLKLAPVQGEMFKMGAHPPQPALAAVRDGFALVQKADAQEGQYPEGADGAGLSVEVYHHDARGAGEYVEMEAMSPLRRLSAGSVLTTRWSIHELPVDWTAQTIAGLLGTRDRPDSAQPQR